MPKPPSTFSRTLHVLLPTALIAAAPGAFAQGLDSANLIKGGEETLTLDLGGILNEFSTKLRLDGTVRGSDVNLENEGLKKSSSSFEAAAMWRFFPRHRFDLLYFEATRSGSRTLDTSLTIKDEVFPAGLSLDSKLKDQFWIGDYRYSFLKQEKVEVAALLGIYGAQLKYDASATGLVSGATRNVSVATSTTLPLPVLGGTVDWYINPRWKIAGSVSGLKAHIDSVDGSVLVAGLSTEFMLVRNFGVGLAYMYTDINVDVSKNDFSGNLSWRFSSVRAYAQLKF